MSAASTPTRPRPLDRYPNATWDGQCWRDGAYWYDERTADKAARFFAEHLVFTEGEWAGRPFVLEPWQEHDIIRPLFGWKRADGTRRYRRCFVWVPRKNGKTELAAGVSLLVLLGDGEMGGQVYSIASEKDQASIVFRKSSKMVDSSPMLVGSPPGGAGLITLRESIYCPSLNASFRPLSGKAEGKHGLNMSGLIGDEMHEWRDGDLYTFVHDSASSRRQPLEFLISTAGQKGTHGEDLWNECQAILSGDVDDPETMVVIYAAGADDDWTAEETWRKANPNWGRSVKVDAFKSDLNRARQLPRLENDFRRYRLNQWTDQAVRWLPIDAVNDVGFRFGWDHCIGPTPWRDLDAMLVGKRCFGGLDLSSVEDLSALVWFFPVQDGLPVATCLARFWKPADLVKDHGRRDRLPYARWVEEGALATTPGNIVDYAFIQRCIYRDAERYKVAFAGGADREQGQGGLAIDRWNATETATKLQEQGIAVALFGQGFGSMSSPSKALEQMVLSNGIHHGGHPVLRQHAKAVSIETNAADDIKPVKPGRGRARIDGIPALVMAIGIAARDTREPASIYEERGILTV